MREGWEYKKLLDICNIQYGYPFDSAGFTTNPAEGMPLIRIRDVKDGQTETYFCGKFPEEYIFHKGEHLIGMDGEFNIAPWKSKDALLNQRVCKVTSKDNKTDIGFIYRFLKKELKRIEDETPFVTVKHLSAKRLDKVFLFVPPLSEQQRIVSELDLLTSIIDKQKAQLKELDTLAQSIFYDMFGDPVENEKGWEVKKLGDLSTFKNGLNYGKIDSGKFIKILGVSDFQDNRSVHASFLSSIQVEEEIDEDYFLRDNDLVFVRSNGSKALVGRCVLVDTCKEKITYSGFCIRCRIIDHKVEPLFLSRVMQNASVRPIITNAGNGCNISNVNQKILSTFNIILPPLPLQQLFAAKIEAIEKQKAAISQSVAETQKLFDYTMDKYFG
ncbi:MAG: restriction endonuclease subunit S [Bacteroidales bacterium]|nr:restriction endonuclease subunit S [Bacteroidales bacterium]